MKIITIGDLHGRDTWKKAPDADLYVFIGDYTDSFNKTDKEITDNLLDIIEFKKQSPDEVILLWGNHDVQYALQPPGSNNKHYASGYRSMHHWELYPIFRDNFELFQVAYQHDNYLFTHAGLHKGWYMNRFVPETGFDPEKDSIVDTLNRLIHVNSSCLFDVGYHRGGHLPVGGPLWLHKFPGRKYQEPYYHVVGHTVTKKIHTESGNNVSVTFIDVPEGKQFYTINIKQ